MSLHVCPNIRCCEVQGLLVILDLQTEGYYVLDSVGTSMWKALLSTMDGARASQMLLSEYSIERVRLEADLAAFQNQCVERGFLQEIEPETRAAIPVRTFMPQRRFLTLRAWWCLLRTVRSLSVRGFARTYEKYSQLPIPAADFDPSDELLGEGLVAFTRAENWF